MKRALTLNRRERILSALTVCAVLSGSLYVYIIEPVTQSWLELRGQANNAAQELSELEHLIANRGTIETEYEEYAGAMTVGASEEALQVDLLREVERLASSVGLRVSSIKPIRLRESGQLNRLGVELNSACAAHEFVKFLEVVQEPNHLLRAEDIHLAVGRERPPLSVTFTLTKLVRIDRARATSGGTLR